MTETFSSAFSKEYFKDILDGFGENPLVGINVTDAEGRVLFLNKAHREITGHDPQLYENKTMYDLLNEGLISESAAIEVIKTNKPVLINQISSHRDKKFKVYAIPYFGEDKKLKYVINYLIDATRLVALEPSEPREGTPSSPNELLRKYLGSSYNIVYQSKAMETVIEAATRIASHDVSVLITGPSGVGKEMISNFIHDKSENKNGPFIKINCASIPDQLLESELFGYEPGAFTGGSPKGKKGLIESAEGGTLLLDEIGEMSMNLQAKLLRALQSRQIRHLGGVKDIDVNFRLITSTNENLHRLIEEKKFRDDLYYRISVIELYIPGLDKRLEDIPLLIQYFLANFNEKYHEKKTIDADALEYLSTCHYSGNVRELRNLVERMLLMGDSAVITLDDVLLYAKRLNVATPRHDQNEDHLSQILTHQNGSLKDIVADYEKEILQQYLKHYKSGAQVAKVLKTDQSTVSRKMAKYGLTV